MLKRFFINKVYGRIFDKTWEQNHSCKQIFQMSTWRPWMALIFGWGGQGRWSFHVFKVGAILGFHAPWTQRTKILQRHLYFRGPCRGNTFVIYYSFSTRIFLPNIYTYIHLKIHQSNIYMQHHPEIVVFDGKIREVTPFLRYFRIFGQLRNSRNVTARVLPTSFSGRAQDRKWRSENQRFCQSCFAILQHNYRFIALLKKGWY